MKIEPGRAERSAAGQLRVTSWETMTAGDEAAPLELVFNCACAQVSGEFGGAGVVMEGSLDGKIFGPFARPIGEKSTITDGRIVLLDGPVCYVRPRLERATEQTRLTIKIAVRS